MLLQLIVASKPIILFWLHIQQQNLYNLATLLVNKNKLPLQLEALVRKKYYECSTKETFFQVFATSLLKKCFLVHPSLTFLLLASTSQTYTSSSSHEGALEGDKASLEEMVDKHRSTSTVSIVTLLYFIVMIVILWD